MTNCFTLCETRKNSMFDRYNLYPILWIVSMSLIVITGMPFTHHTHHTAVIAPLLLREWTFIVNFWPQGPSVIAIEWAN